MEINAVYCKRCNEVVQSKSVHDFQWCSGRHIYVDGGNDYQRVGWNSGVNQTDMFVVKLVPFFPEEKLAAMTAEYEGSEE
jgi:hypothetical protein